MDDELILVDIDDNVVGYMSKGKIHEIGKLHRAFSIFIYNENKMLLQKRNINKYHSGGLWSNACCSHPRKNEILSECIHRRLKEEMGFDCNLEEKFSFIYRTSFHNSLIEYELDHVFLGKYNKDVKNNIEEVSEYKWIDINDLKNELKDYPERFSYWFIISVPKIIKMIEENLK